MANKKQSIPTSQFDNYRKRPAPTKLCNTLIAWSGNHMTNKKCYFLTSMRAVAIEPGKALAFDEGLLSAKSSNLLITCWHEIRWQIKNFISTFLAGLWPLTFTNEGLWYESRIYKPHWSRGEVRPREKSKKLLYNAYGHPTWQGSGFG